MSTDSIRQYQREYYHRNKEKLRERAKRWCSANPDKVRATKQKWWAANKDASKEKHREWCRTLKGCLTRKLYHIKKAKRKDRKVEIDVEFILSLWDQQDGKCAVSGYPMKFAESDLFGVSIDRIDSNGDYIKDNVQLVCQGINFLPRTSIPTSKSKSFGSIEINWRNQMDKKNNNQVRQVNNYLHCL